MQAGGELHVFAPDAAPGMMARPPGRVGAAPPEGGACAPVVMASGDTGNTISAATSVRPDSAIMLCTLRTMEVIIPASVPSTNCSLHVHHHIAINIEGIRKCRMFCNTPGKID